MVPPLGWEQYDSAGTAATWGITSTLPNDGSYAAAVIYPGNDNPVDTWLISPAFIVNGDGHIRFASSAATFWCREPNDNCDLEVWVIKGNTVGDSDDTLLGKADPDWPANDFVWTNHEFTFNSADHSGPIRIGFRMRSENGGDAVILDSIEILNGAQIYLPFLQK